MLDVIAKYLDENEARLFGDNFIGYRAQLPNGSYDDVGFSRVYEDLGGNEVCDQFNEACFALRAGPHNW